MAGDVVGRWWCDGADIIGSSPLDGEPSLICRLNTDAAGWQGNAGIIAAIPELLLALQAARQALEASARFIELDSDADLAAARALGMIYALSHEHRSSLAGPGIEF
jgi:hypothetical protein